MGNLFKKLNISHVIMEFMRFHGVVYMKFSYNVIENNGKQVLKMEIIIKSQYRKNRSRKLMTVNTFKKGEWVKQIFLSINLKTIKKIM